MAVRSPVVVWIHSVTGLQFGVDKERLKADLELAGVEVVFVTASEKAHVVIRGRNLISNHASRVRAVVQNMRRTKETSGLEFIDAHHKACRELGWPIPVATLSEILTANPTLLLKELSDRFETTLRCNLREEKGCRQLFRWILDQCCGVLLEAIFVRHGQAEHNATHNWNLHDPMLTEKGKLQAKWLKEHDLINLISAERKDTLVISSPLKRPLQTAQHAGLQGRAILLEPDLQECGEAPCDIGTDKTTLQEWIKTEGINTSTDFLREDWEKKTGINTFDNIAVRLAQVATRARKGEYGPSFVAVAHDHALQQLLHLDGSSGPSWSTRAWTKFQNCEARGYWMLGDGRWFPIPGIQFVPPSDVESYFEKVHS